MQRSARNCLCRCHDTRNANNDPLLDDDILIPAGQTSITNIAGLEGQTIDEEFLGDGSIGQTIQLSFPSVTLDSVRVEVDGIRWDEVDFFTDSQPRQEYRLEFNSEFP